MSSAEVDDIEEYVDRLERAEIAGFGLIYDDGSLRRDIKDNSEDKVRSFLSKQLSRHLDDDDTIEEIVDEIFEREFGVNTIPQSIQTEIKAEKNGYWQYSQNKDGTVSTYQVTNFLLQTIAFLTVDDGDEYVEIEVIPCNSQEEPYSVVAPWKAFNDVRQFKDTVVIGRTTTYKGTGSHLNDLRLIVSFQDAPHLERVDKVGLFDDQIVTAEAVLGTDEPAYIYDRKPNSISQKFELDTLDYDVNIVREILELIPKTRYNQRRLLAILGWYLGSLQAPRIREIEGEITHAEISGETGSGKTTFLAALEQLVGLSGDPLSAGVTRFSLLMAFSASTNLPLWIDEYKPTEIDDNRLDVLHEYMRKATKGALESRGKTDLSEEFYELEAPVLLSGEQRVNKSAENRRMITVRLSKDGRNKEAWNELSEYDLSEVAPLVWSKLIQDSEFDAKWLKANEAVQEIAEDELEGLYNIGLSTVYLGLQMFVEMGDEVGAEVEITDMDIREVIKYLLENDGDDYVSYVDTFLRLFSEAAASGKATYGEDYGITKTGKPDEKLELKLPRAHATVRKYVSDHDLNEDVLDQYQDYRDRFQELEMQESSFVDQSSRPSNIPGMNRCVVLQMEKMEEEIDDFDSHGFERQDH